MHPPELYILIQENFFNFSMILARKRLINGKILKICLEEYIFLKSTSFKEHFDVFFVLIKNKTVEVQKFQSNFFTPLTKYFCIYLWCIYQVVDPLYLCQKLDENISPNNSSLHFKYKCQDFWKIKFCRFPSLRHREIKYQFLSCINTFCALEV